MIITIVGTSGSGKTYLMRSFIKWLQEQGKMKPRMIPDRIAPIGYDIRVPDLKPLFLVGAYEEADTAGCDTIRNVVQVFDLIIEEAEKGHVVYEGLIVMNHTRGPALAAEFGEQMVVLQLMTPYATCIASINDRRRERGEGKLLNKDNTQGNFVRATNYCTKMRAAGARVIKINRSDGLRRMTGLLEEDLNDLVADAG